MSETKYADTTALGLILVAFALLFFGFIGVLSYVDGSLNALAFQAGAMGYFAAILFLLIAVAQFMSGNKFLMVLFGFIAFSFALFSDIYQNVLGNDGFYAFILIGVIYLIFALWAFLAKAGYMLIGILVMAALAFIMFALAANADPMATFADAEIFFLLMGVFAFIGGILAIYLAIVDTTGLKLPVY